MFLCAKKNLRESHHGSLIVHGMRIKDGKATCLPMSFGGAKFMKVCSDNHHAPKKRTHASGYRSRFDHNKFVLIEVEKRNI